MEKINIYGFKYIVIINAYDSFGVKYIHTSVNGAYIRIGTESLVNGDNKNGVWEFLHDGVKLGSDYVNSFTIENFYDLKQEYQPSYPFSTSNIDQTLVLPEIKLSGMYYLI